MLNVIALFRAPFFFLTFWVQVDVDKVVSSCGLLTEITFLFVYSMILSQHNPFVKYLKKKTLLGWYPSEREEPPSPFFFLEILKVL